MPQVAQRCSWSVPWVTTLWVTRSSPCASSKGESAVLLEPGCNLGRHRMPASHLATDPEAQLRTQTCWPWQRCAHGWHRQQQLIHLWYAHCQHTHAVVHQQFWCDDSFCLLGSYGTCWPVVCLPSPSSCCSMSTDCIQRCPGASTACVSVINDRCACRKSHACTASLDAG
jgi:hypothetical protein